MKTRTKNALVTVLGLALGAMNAAQAAPDPVMPSETDHNQENVSSGTPATGPRLPVTPPTPSRHALEFQDEDVPYAASLVKARGGGNIIRVGSDSLTCDHDNLASAISSADDGDIIHLQDATSLYLGQTYNLFNKSLTIRGGFESCTDDTPSGRTTLDSDGGNRLFDILLESSISDEMTVTLENLVIRGASTGGQLGGGGMIVEGRQGALFVSLINVEVQNNELTGENGHGGGINVRVNGDREGPGLMLTMDDDSTLFQNSATGNGGGIACTNQDSYSTDGPLVRLGAVDIVDNSATNGGGIAVRDCANFIYYSGGPLFLFIPSAALASNTATENGGGIFVEDGSQVFINGSQFSGFGDGDHAAHIVLNEAERGGGGYVRGENSLLRFNDAVINGNHADLDGGGLYVDEGSELIMTRNQSGACQPSETSSGVTTVPRCSRINNNYADRDGGAYFVNNDAELAVERTIMTENEADRFGSIIRARSDLDSGQTGTAVFSDSLAYNNVGTTLFYAWTNSDITMNGTTVTDNNEGNHVFRAFTNSGEARVRITSSIIWDPDRPSLMSEGGDGTFTLTSDCLIGHQDREDTDFSSATVYSMINPQLLEYEDKPYFPSPSSPAIDYCDDVSFPGDATDLTDNQRGTAHQGPPIIEPPNSVNNGVYDLGAYETQWEDLPEVIFEDRFEEL